MHGGRRETTQAIEDYLKVIYKLSARGGRATVVSIAARMEKSAPSVTKMVKKMASMGLVHHAPYGRILLDPRGTRIALEIIRHHRLWELYLARRLGLPLDQVDAEAERLEHVTSDAMEARMTALLGNPGQDPHGDPIPTPSGILPNAPEGRRLSELGPGESGVVAHLSDRHPGHVRTMAALGLLPGVRVRVVRARPGREALGIRIGGRAREVGREVAALVRVV